MPIRIACDQIIVATDVGTNASDVGTLMPMTEQAAANTGQLSRQLLADAGYCAVGSLDRATAFTAEFCIATGRVRRGDPPPVAPRGRIPGSATGKQRMARELATCHNLRKLHGHIGVHGLAGHATS